MQTSWNHPGCFEVEAVVRLLGSCLPSTAWLTSFTISKQLSRESASTEEKFYVASWRRVRAAECIKYIYPLTAHPSLAGHTLSLLLHLRSFKPPAPELGALKQKRPDSPRQDPSHHCLRSWDKSLNLTQTRCARYRLPPYRVTVVTRGTMWKPQVLSE